MMPTKLKGERGRHFSFLVLSMPARTVFFEGVLSARLYGSRSRKNQKLLDGVRQAVQESAVC